MKMNPLFRTFLLPALLLVFITACKKELRNGTATEDHASATLDKPAVANSAGAKMLETDLLKDVRRATSRFHSTTQAIAAGYEADDHCVSVPGLGGMGYHWMNSDLVDEVFDPMKPEALLYATGPGGNLRLVAVEYIVLDEGQAHPMFGNQPFDVGGTPVPLPHWSLHVWLYENNPSGMFTPFNPNISCP